MIGKHARQRGRIFDRAFDRTEAAGLRAEHRFDFVGRGRTEKREAERAEFGFFEFVAAAQDDEEGLAVADEDQGLELLVARNRIRRRFERRDRDDAGRGKFLDRARRGRVRQVLRHEPLVAFSRLAA